MGYSLLSVTYATVMSYWKPCGLARSLAWHSQFIPGVVANLQGPITAEVGAERKSQWSRLYITSIPKYTKKKLCLLRSFTSVHLIEQYSLIGRIPLSSGARIKQDKRNLFNLDVHAKLFRTEKKVSGDSIGELLKLWVAPVVDQIESGTTQ